MTLPVFHVIGGALTRYQGTATAPPAPPPPPPPTAIPERFPGDPNPLKRGRLYWGMSKDTNGDVSGHEQAAGAKLGVHRKFFSTTAQVAPPNGGLFVAVRDDHANDRYPMVSFKVADWAAAAAGASDAAFDWIIGELESYAKPTMLILNHEPENDGLSAADWRGMQTRFRQRMNVYGAAHGGIKRIAFASCLMTYTWNPTSGRDPEDWWCGTGVHDVVTGDHYTETNQSIERQPLNSFIAWCKTKGVPFGIAEWGLRAADTSGATKMQTFFDHMSDGTKDCVALAYFNSTANSTGAGWVLANTSTNGGMLTKFHALMKDPRAMHMSDLGY